MEKTGSKSNYSTDELLKALSQAFWFISNKGNSCTKIDRLPRQFQVVKWKEIYDYENNVHYIHWQDVIIRERIRHTQKPPSGKKIVETFAEENQSNTALYQSMADEMREKW